MANICTNIFYCSSDNEQNIRKIEQFISEQFGWDVCNAEDNYLEGEFGCEYVSFRVCRDGEWSINL